MSSRVLTMMLLLVAGIAVLRAQIPGGAAAPLMAPMSERVFTGETKAVGTVTVTAWVMLNASGHPTAIGVTLTESALTNLPAANTEYALSLPPQASETPFNHVALNWLPKGHIPVGIYDVPHFDFHFYTITPTERNQITGSGADVARARKNPPSGYLPQGYFPAPSSFEPYMGQHWVSPSFPELNGKPFTASALYGSYNGRVAFLEPMVSLAFLQTKPAFTSAFPRPAQVAKPGYYPTQYTVIYDANRHEYTIALMGLTYRQ